MKKMLPFYVLVSLVFLLSACGNISYNRNSSSEDNRDSAETTSDVDTTNDFDADGNNEVADNDGVSDTEEESSVNEPQRSNMAVSDFSEGRAWISYVENGTTVEACIDENGTILFRCVGRQGDSTDPDGYTGSYWTSIYGYTGQDYYGGFTPFESGYSFFYNGSYLMAINSDGKIVFDEEQMIANGEIDSAISFGGGYVLCYKYESSFEDAAELYGVYDCNTQQWSIDYCELPLRYYYRDIAEVVKYHGDGVFTYPFVSARHSGFVLISGKDGTVSSIRLQMELGSGFYNYDFIGGKTYGKVSTDMGSSNNISIVYSNGERFETEISGTRIYQDENCICCYYSYNSELWFYRYESNETICLENSATEHFSDNSSIAVYGDYIVLMNLTGADENQYYAVYDFDGNEIVGVTQYSGEMSSSCERILIEDGEQCQVLDLQGNQVFEMSEEGFYLAVETGYSDGLVWVKDSNDDYVCIDTNGNIVINEYKENANTVEIALS